MTGLQIVSNDRSRNRQSIVNSMIHEKKSFLILNLSLLILFSLFQLFKNKVAHPKPMRGNVAELKKTFIQLKFRDVCTKNFLADILPL